MPKKPPPPVEPARHLAASLRVVRFQENRRSVTIADARKAVLQAAGHVKAGIAGPETEDLVRRLEKVTGVPIAELEQHALRWHDA